MMKRGETMKAQPLELEGKPYVLLERGEYDRLKTLAKAGEVPPTPEPDKAGNFPAVPYARASIAKSIIRERAELGLNQKELAERAGIRVETLCRIETGKHTPSIRTIERIDAVLKQVGKEKKKARPKRAKKAG
jgi:DNA-binding XRE family transcriptional regulator